MKKAIDLLREAIGILELELKKLLKKKLNCQPLKQEMCLKHHLEK